MRLLKGGNKYVAKLESFLINPIFLKYNPKIRFIVVHILHFLGKNVIFWTFLDLWQVYIN